MHFSRLDHFRKYRFDHNRIHEVVFAGICEPLREEYHKPIAEAYIEREEALGRREERSLLRTRRRASAGLRSGWATSTPRGRTTNAV